MTAKGGALCRTRALVTAGGLAVVEKAQRPDTAAEDAASAVVTTELPLFAYGTLGDSAVQEILFGGTIRSEPATLAGWRVTTGADPYLNISRAEGASARGRLLSLSRAELRVADQFEEIPFYRRIAVTARTADGTEREAWIYTRQETIGEPRLDDRLSALTRSELLKVTREYRKQLDRCDVPFGDLYILVPCLADLALDPASPADVYIDTIARTARTPKVVRTVAREIEIVCGKVSGDDWLELGRHLTRPILRRDMGSGLAVLTIPMPAISVPVLPLLDSLSSGTLRVHPSGGEKPCTLHAWMEGLGMTSLGGPSVAMFLSEMPRGAVLNSLKGAQSVALEVPGDFAELYEDRLSGQASRLVSIELSLLKEAKGDMAGLGRTARP